MQFFASINFYAMILTIFFALICVLHDLLIVN